MDKYALGFGAIGLAICALFPPWIREGGRGFDDVRYAFAFGDGPAGVFQIYSGLLICQFMLVMALTAFLSAVAVAEDEWHERHDQARSKQDA